MEMDPTKCTGSSASSSNATLGILTKLMVASGLTYAHAVTQFDLIGRAHE